MTRKFQGFLRTLIGYVQWRDYLFEFGINLVEFHCQVFSTFKRRNLQNFLQQYDWLMPLSIYEFQITLMQMEKFQSCWGENPSALIRLPMIFTWQLTNILRLHPRLSSIFSLSSERIWISDFTALTLWQRIVGITTPRVEYCHNFCHFSWTYAVA